MYCQHVNWKVTKQNKDRPMTQDDLAKEMFKRGFSKSQMCEIFEVYQNLPLRFDTLPKTRKFPKRRQRR